MSALENFRNKLKALHAEDDSIVGRIAAAAGTSRAQIDRYLKGTEPGIDSAEAVAKALGTSLSDMIGKERPEFAPPRDPTPEELTVAMLKRFGIEKERMEAIEKLLVADAIAVRHCLSILRGGRGLPARKNNKASLG